LSQLNTACWLTTSRAAQWAEYLDWETTPVFTDEEAGPICAKIYG